MNRYLFKLDIVHTIKFLPCFLFKLYPKNYGFEINVKNNPKYLYLGFLYFRLEW